MDIFSKLSLLRSLRQTQIWNYMGLWIAGDNRVQWRFENVEINYLNLSLTGILKLNFIAYFLLREKFDSHADPYNFEFGSVTQITFTVRVLLNNLKLDLLQTSHYAV